jgi:hypothetical protein
MNYILTWFEGNQKLKKRKQFTNKTIQSYGFAFKPKFVSEIESGQMILDSINPVKSISPFTFRF